MSKKEYIIFPCPQTVSPPPVINDNTQSSSHSSILQTFIEDSELFKFNYAVFLHGVSISLNKSCICFLCYCFPRNVSPLKMVAVSNQTLSFLISKVEIMMDTSQGLGQEQIRLHMSKSFINLTLYLSLGYSKCPRSAAASNTWELVRNMSVGSILASPNC